MAKEALCEIKIAKKKTKTKAKKKPQNIINVFFTSIKYHCCLVKNYNLEIINKKII